MKMEKEQHYCQLPFNTILIYRYPIGRVVPCCFSPVVTGNIMEQPIEEIWNSAEIQELRASIIDGSYRFCPKSCYMISRSPTLDELPPHHREFVRTGQTKLPLTAIERLSDGHDGRCNLACPSCRDASHQISEDEYNGYKIVEEQLRKILTYVKEYDTSLQGDPFASPFTREMLQTMNPKDYPRLEIVSIETNGLLLTPKMWRSMQKIHDLIRIINISIDAATKKTYHINRFPGKWEKLCKNIDFLAKERKKMQNPFHFLLKFVIQQNNYREVVDFANLCEKWGAETFLQQIENWGTYTDEEFWQRAVHLAGHPEHEAFMAIMRHPDLRKPHVDWGTLNTAGITRDAMGT
ncbi:MAG: radical SAM protein [Spartobacteria bacterium]|nr:radical SAM protein [Spartobacteria bacterium]